MGVKILNLKNRVVEHELHSRVWKLKNGYKMSRKAMRQIGANLDSGTRVIFGTDDSNRLAIRVVNDHEEYHATISKSGMINAKGAVNYLSSLGELFTVTNEVNDSYYIMTVENIDTENTDTTHEDTSDIDTTETVEQTTGATTDQW